MQINPLLKSKLRGHHLICLNFFRGEGYSEDFIKNIYSVIAKETVEIVIGADDVCSRCPHLRNNKCSNPEYSDEQILYQDHEALALLGYQPGITVNRKEISTRIPEIIEEWKTKFCRSCGYKKVCFGDRF
jgi:hypothetical protein